MTLPDDLLEAIEAVEAFRASRQAFEDKFLVNGFLCVTPEQYKAIRDMGADKPIGLYPSWHSSYVPVGSIEVLVINPGEQRDVGDGWIAVNFGGTIYGMKLPANMYFPFDPQVITPLGPGQTERPANT